MPHTDSRSPYVHRVNLYDADGEIISPEDMPPQPYSPRITCAKCHPYGKISSGWHFSAGSDVDEGRPAQPWILIDRRTGTQLPLSYRPWPGAHNPKDVGLTPWQFALRFGRHYPGGGETEKHAEDPVDPKARWGISGRLEVDCMICHGAAAKYNPGERARQLDLQNFKWAHSAATGLAVVRGDASKLPDDFDPFMPDPAGGDQKAPTVAYDEAQFDADERVLFSMKRKPAAERCYFCHTNREVGPEKPEKWQVDEDVHLASGLTCADCHRHGLDHAITRGYESQSRASLSCRGCHLGSDGESRGRLGAPRPRHLGLPTSHFDELTCAACHSGLKPSMTPRHIQTGRAHGLGLSSKHRGADAPPLIQEPVFMRGADGKIAPYRATWPAFWARIDGDRVPPIPIEAVANVVEKAVGKRKAEDHAPWAPLHADKVAEVLQALGTKGGYPVYVVAGVALQSDGDKLRVLHDLPAARPYTWRIGHDVRPASQALGAGGCGDCHSAASPFFFGNVAGEGPPITGGPAAKSNRQMHELMGQDPKLLAAWALLARYRVAFISINLICAAILLATLVHAKSGWLIQLSRER